MTDEIETIVHLSIHGSVHPSSYCKHPAIHPSRHSAIYPGIEASVNSKHLAIHLGVVASSPMHPSKHSAIYPYIHLRHPIMMYNIANNLAPKYTVNSSNYYNLRKYKNDFRLPKCKTNCYGKELAIPGAQVWNSLFESLKEAQSLKLFMNQLRRYLPQYGK